MGYVFDDDGSDFQTLLKLCFVAKFNGTDIKCCFVTMQASRIRRLKVVGCISKVTQKLRQKIGPTARQLTGVAVTPTTSFSNSLNCFSRCISSALEKKRKRG